MNKPYDEEWEKEMMKLSKKMIIDMLRNTREAVKFYETYKKLTIAERDNEQTGSP